MVGKPSAPLKRSKIYREHLDFKGNWDDHFPLIEFSNNNNYHSSIDITLLTPRMSEDDVDFLLVGLN